VKRSQRTVTLAIGVAILARLAVLAAGWSAQGGRAILVPDSGVYRTLAISIAEKGAFTDWRHGGLPELFRTPGYPFIIAPGWAWGHLDFWAIALNFVLASGVVALTWRGSQMLFADDRLAAAAAVAAALEPTMLFWSVKVMPETLLTFCLAGFVISSIEAVRTRRTGWALLAGVAVCGAAYAKPVAWPFVILTMTASIVAAVRWRGRRARLSLAFVATCVLLLAPWHIRNARVARYPGFSTLFDHALYISAAGSLEARHAGRAYREVRRERVEHAGDARESMRYGALRSEGWRAVRSDLPSYAVIHLTGMVKTLFDPGIAAYLQFLGLLDAGQGVMPEIGREGLMHGSETVAKQHPLAFWMSVAGGLFLLPLVLLPVSSLVLARGEERTTLFLLAMMVAYFVVAGGGVPGTSRFRVPIVPILIVMSAAAIRGWRVRRLPATEAPDTLDR